MQAPQSRLVLVGIANSIDLTERALPKLEGTGHAAQLVPFASYSAAQLGALLSGALAGLPGPAFHEAALKFCAKAVRPSERAPHDAPHSVVRLISASPVPARACLGLLSRVLAALWQPSLPRVCMLQPGAVCCRPRLHAGCPSDCRCPQVASRSGDMRRALEACRLALDILAAEATKQLHAVREDAGEHSA